MKSLLNQMELRPCISPLFSPREELLLLNRKGKSRKEELKMMFVDLLQLQHQAKGELQAQAVV